MRQSVIYDETRCIEIVLNDLAVRNFFLGNKKYRRQYESFIDFSRNHSWTIWHSRDDNNV